MEKNILELEKFQEVITVYGFDLLLSLAMLVLGLIIAKFLLKYFKLLLQRFIRNVAVVSTVANIVCVLFIMFVIAVSLQHAGMHTIVIRRIIIAASLATVAVIIVFRPLLPTLPFKVGQTVKAGDLLGKVESTSVLNTRLRTFDGRTFFVPNYMILKDIVQNYHYTPTRRIKINVGIRYDQDLMKAKQVLDAIIWVDNVKYWKTRCDLLEKIKLRFDAEGIVIAYPQRDVHIYYENASEDSFGEASSVSEENTSDPTKVA
jgi:small conductance mechanosensitive channel